MFLEEYEMITWAAALPATVALEPASKRAIASAQENGFQCTFVFPPVRHQRRVWKKLVKKFAGTIAVTLPSDQQYDASPMVRDEEAWPKHDVKNRPDTAYLLMMRPGAAPEDSFHQTASACEKRFCELGATGLTAFEYLVLQRFFAVEHGDHRFDDYYGHEEHPPGWQWLVDSRVGKKVAFAYWNPKKRHVTLSACSGGQKNPKKCAYPAVIVPFV